MVYPCMSPLSGRGEHGHDVLSFHLISQLSQLS